VVVLVNGQFAIVKQWRLPLGGWAYEGPRGFGEELGKGQIPGTLGTLKNGDFPLGTLAPELGEEVVKDAVITSVTHLGNIAENSGTSNVVPSYFLVHIEIDAEKLASKLGGGDDEIKVQLWSAARVRTEIGRKLCDNHTITAVALALRHVESLTNL